MPVQSPLTKKSSIVHRSESLRSEVSDASQQSKRVSFNRDVHVKRIPRGSAVVDRNGKLIAVLNSTPSGGGGEGDHSTREGTNGIHGDIQEGKDRQSSERVNGRLWINSLAPSKEILPEEDLRREAEAVLKHVDSVTCTSSGFDTRSLERSKSLNGHNNKNYPKTTKVTKSSSRLSDFFSRTLPQKSKSGVQKSASSAHTSSSNRSSVNGSKSPSPAPNGISNNGLKGVNGVNGVNGVKAARTPKRVSRSRSRSRELSPSLDLHDFMSRSEPNLFNGIKYSKNGGKIKKQHGGRVALNSIGETPTGSSGSGSDKDSFPKKLSASESPVSSLSGPEELSMANSSYDNQNRVSSIVQQLSSRRNKGDSQNSSGGGAYNFSNTPTPERVSSLSPGGGNTHNNNKPFSYLGGKNNSNNNSGGIVGEPERGKSPGKSSLLQNNKGGAAGGITPKEVIYAQVVVSGKSGEGGAPTEKRTVHTRVTNGAVKDKSSSPSPQRTVGFKKNNSTDNNSSERSRHDSSSSPTSIQHLVYESPRKVNSNRRSSSSVEKNLKNGFGMNDYNSFRSPGYRSSYDDYDFTASKPRNNVTTVLLNNVDDDDTSFSSGRNNYYSGYRNRSPSPSPNYHTGPEKTFYFGGSSSSRPGPTAETRYSSSSPYNNYSKSPAPRMPSYSSSREASPLNRPISSAFLVRDAERKKDSMVPSAKLVNTFGNPMVHHRSSYDYMEDDNSRHSSPGRHLQNSYDDSEALLSKPKYKSSVDLDKYKYSSSSYHHNSQDPHNKKYRSGHSSKHGTPNASNSSINKLGLRSKENSPHRREYSKSSSPEKSVSKSDRDETSMERKYNKKNKDVVVSSSQEEEKVNTTKSNSSSGGGLISTLMRRNKDKKKEGKEMKESKDKKDKSPETGPGNHNADEDGGSNKEGKIKRQRAKFFSAFLDKNFSSKKNQSNQVTSNTTGNGTLEKKSKKNTKPTDSEIEEAERRRDGEYQSWSSGEDEYRFGYLQRNGGLTRGKSYNFGDLKEDSEGKPWYDQNDSDYRREMATSRYTSATLGRPGMRSSNYESDGLRSKSLDRRSYRNRSPPRIVVTPNTPAVEDEDNDKWKSTYDPIIRSFDRDRVNGHSALGKKVSGLSRSSYELDDHGSDNNNFGGRNRVSAGGGKLRYFGDTDAEDMNNYQNDQSYLAKSNSSRNTHNKFIPRTSSYLSKGRENYAKYDTVPGSSLNSSGSENGSRMSKASSNGGSQRSVYLHAPAVADIPPSGLQRRTLSRDELSNHSGHQKQTRHLARSMSVLAPWRPRHYKEKLEVNYNNDSKENQNHGRPPKPPRSPNRKSMSPSFGRAESTDSLLKLSDDKSGKSTIGKNSTLSRKKDNVSVSRSKSMPKDTRFSGWLWRRRFGKESK